MKEKSDQNESHVPNDLISRSDEVQEVLGHVPHWIVRWGITIIAAISIFFLIGCYFFRYQEKISAEISIVSVPPAAFLSPSQNGVLTHVYVSNGEHVSWHQKLASISIRLERDSALIESPIEGTVNFLSDCSYGGVVTGNTPLFVITPSHISNYRGVMHLSSEEICRVKKGMTVRLKPNELGHTSSVREGTVSSISTYPDANGRYLVEVEFDAQSSPPNHLQNEITPTHAEIILCNKRLLESLLQPLEKWKIKAKEVNP